MDTEKKRLRDRWRDREANCLKRQTDTLIKRQTDGDTDRHKERHRDRHTEITFSG